MSHDYGVPEGCERFTVTYEFKTRPLYRKGKLRRESVCFIAKNITQAYELAKSEAEQRFHRRKWKIVSCVGTATVEVN